MTLRYRILAQSNPPANNPTVLYTVPANTATVISTLQICNLSGNTSTIRVSVATANAAIANAQYLTYDTPIIGNDALSMTLGISLGNTDSMTISANTGNVAFSLFGSEIY